MKYLLLLLLMVFSTVYSLASEIYILSGFVKDANTREVLIGAHILAGDNKGAVSDNNGFFILHLSGAQKVHISYIGYNTNEIFVSGERDTFCLIWLESDNQLQEFSIHAQQKDAPELSHFEAKEFDRVATLGGKPDIVKSLQLLPGVQALIEGTGIITVRGGEPGQNQYLLDNIPLTYINHLGGFTSVFNPEMINAVDFYKGNFPAKYGGKLSSIISITQKEGDISEHNGSFSLGVTDASVCFEGPLLKNKMSYIVTARKTLIDAFLIGYTTLSSGNDAIVGFGFYDVNARLSYKPDLKNNFSLNLYSGDDYFSFWTKPWKMEPGEKNKITQNWGNWLLSGTWKRAVNEKILMQSSLSFTRFRNSTLHKYKFIEGEEKQVVHIEQTSAVSHTTAQTTIKTIALPFWRTEFGAKLSYIWYAPGETLNSTLENQAKSLQFNSFDNSLFVDNQITLSPYLKLQPSLRLSLYLIDKARFCSMEPRLALNIKPNSKNTFSINYMKLNQNSHMFLLQDVVLKSEVWFPATKELSPQVSDQYSINWNADLFDNKAQLLFSTYFKRMNNLVRLIPGYENVIGMNNLDNYLLTSGKGLAYGSEITLKKNTGSLTGSISYSWSESKRSFPEINEGEFYAYEYNRPHSAAISINKQFWESWNLNANWQIMSGLPYNPPIGKHYTYDLVRAQMNEDVALNYYSFNSGRTQNYHRLDIGLSYQKINKNGRKVVWTFSVYNAYNQKNAFWYYYDNDNDINNVADFSQPLSTYKYCLMPIVPSISYKVYFKSKHLFNKFKSKSVDI